MKSKHNKRIIKEFTKQAERMTISSFFNKSDIVKKIISSVPLSLDLTILDLCCGTGVLTVNIAPHVSKVYALDITPRMI
jgi:ubiquinone/menaquinone biosynthesis C-methylase UbiE